MIDFAAHAIVTGGCVVALGLAAFLILAAFGEAFGRAIDTCREARDTAAEAKARHALYPAPDLEARGTVIEMEIPAPSLDQAVRMVGGDGWRNR